jgi:glucose-1-phosphatase
MAPEEMFQAVYGGGLEDAFEEGKISPADFLKKCRQLCRLRCDEDFMATAFADIFQPNPEVCDLIPQLAGRYRILLGSNTNELHSRQFLRQFAEVLGQFHHLVLSCRINIRKPEAGFFEHCRQKAECQASECLFIDDLPANIAGAQAVGLHGIVYRPDGTLRQQLGAHGVKI